MLRFFRIQNVKIAVVGIDFERLAISLMQLMMAIMEYSLFEIPSCSSGSYKW